MLLRLLLSTPLHTQTFPSVRPPAGPVVWDSHTSLTPGLQLEGLPEEGGMGEGRALAVLRATLVHPASNPPIRASGVLSGHPGAPQGLQVWRPHFPTVLAPLPTPTVSCVLHAALESHPCQTKPTYQMVSSVSLFRSFA